MKQLNFSPRYRDYDTKSCYTFAEPFNFAASVENEVSIIWLLNYRNIFDLLPGWNRATSLPYYM